MPFLQNLTEPPVNRPMQAVDDWTRLRRFLIIGNEDGTYYVHERALAIENATSVIECLKCDGLRVVRTILETSNASRAPKNGPALFALAMAASPNFADAETISAALDALPKAARTAADLCSFAAFAESLRGWGRGLRSAVADWYLTKTASELAHQMLECQRRHGWSHRDLLRLSHPKAATPAHNALFQWAVDGGLGHLATPELLSGDLHQIRAFELAMQSASEDEVVELIEENRLTHEMIPSEWQNSARVWEALLPSMPYVELIRHLGKLTAVGLLEPQSPATALVVARLIDRKRIANSRIHPIALLDAVLDYKREPAPVASIIEALDEAFYLAFENVQPIGKRIYLALEARCSSQGCSYAVASAGLAMVFARREPNCIIAAFDDQIWHLDIAHKDRLERISEAMVREGRSWDPSLPMRDALDRGLAVDAFVIVTSEKLRTGDAHPMRALERYRQSSGLAAKLVVIAMAATGCTIGDPSDALQMGVAGFDASVPEVVAEFLKG
jgi:60 kDa SS-A/Ro ribonucleoprotein